MLAAYGYYHFSGAKSAVATAKSAKSYIDSATDSLKVKLEEKTPEANQAIETLRQSANKYASFVPGGRAYVDAAFQDLESVRKPSMVRRSTTSFVKRMMSCVRRQRMAQRSRSLANRGRCLRSIYNVSVLCLAMLQKTS